MPVPVLSGRFENAFAGRKKPGTRVAAPGGQVVRLVPFKATGELSSLLDGIFGDIM